MGDTYLETSNVIRNAFRSLFSFLDRPAYWLLGLVYELFFNVASADLFANATVMKFYGRVQLILGVFMMFQLSMTILRGIMNPDSFTDSKTGAGNLVTRVVTSLLILTALMPIGISSPANEYEKQISNNGLLFGTLYSLQHRLLANNTIGRLVLGVDSSGPNYLSSDSNTSELKTSARIFTSTILKGFYRINLLPEEKRTQHQDGKDDAVFNANRVCQDIPDDKLAKYTKVDADPGDIIGLVNETCVVDSNIVNYIPVVGDVVGSKMYAFAYMPFISMIVAFIFVFILLSFTVDVAVRAVKLSVLRLIAPIPVISYMDPKGSKDNAFNSWVKTLTSTYLDLFIRLAAVYFVIYLIEDMIKNGIYINNSSGIIGVLSFIIICIGLFVFAKQAPKFIKDVLGIKGETGKLFGGLSEALAVGSIGVGAVGGAISRGVAAHMSGGNLGKSILAGFAGGVGGGYNAGKALWNAKDYDSKAVMNQVRAYNAKNYSNAADDSTFSGRVAAAAQANFGLQNDLQQMDDKIKYYGAAKDALGRMNDAFNSNGDYKSVYHGADILDNSGNVVLKDGESYSLKDYKDKLGRVQASGNEYLIKSVDDAMKKAQGDRLTHLRQTFTGATRDEARAKLEAAIRESAANGTNEYTQRDLDVFDGAYTIYTVAQKYSDEPFFSKFKNKKFDDSSLAWGSAFKSAAATAGDTAKSMKASPAYDRAKANAQRAADSQKK